MKNLQKIIKAAKNAYPNLKKGSRGQPESQEAVDKLLDLMLDNLPELLQALQPSMKLDTEVVINRRYGGYGLSLEAMQMLAARKGLTLVQEDRYWFVEGHEYETIDDSVPRNDPDLLAVVRELGPRANGSSAELKIVKVEAEIAVESHDGRERVYLHGGEYL